MYFKIFETYITVIVTTLTIFGVELFGRDEGATKQGYRQTSDDEANIHRVLCPVGTFVTIHLNSCGEDLHECVVQSHVRPVELQVGSV
jgi:hypothetical protein